VQVPSLSCLGSAVLQKIPSITKTTPRSTFLLLDRHAPPERSVVYKIYVKNSLIYEMYEISSVCPTNMATMLGTKFIEKAKVWSMILRQKKVEGRIVILIGSFRNYWQSL
jgi:hypothetical protein